MIDKYLLEELRRESGEKGELARWVIELQKFLDIERRKTVALESKLARVPDREPVLFCMWKGYLDTESVSDSKDVVDSWVEEWNASGENFKTVTLFTIPPAPAIPDGWRLVPVELTPNMQNAWDNAPNCNNDDDSVNMCNAYRAMIAAAPTP